MTLQQQAIDTIENLPEEKLPLLIQFARSLLSNDASHEIVIDGSETIKQKRQKMYGTLKNKIKIANDFNETPDCFEEYM